jgi:hypothetical protein
VQWNDAIGRTEANRLFRHAELSQRSYKNTLYPNE